MPHRRSSAVSLDLDPLQREILSLPSPYHDHHPEPNSPQHGSSSSPSGPFSAMFKRFKYSQISDRPSPAEHIESLDHDDGASDVTETPETKTRGVHWSEYEETPMDRWWSVLFLLLLLSFLFNVYMIFNGPPNRIPRHPKPKDNPLPHNGFQFKDHGTNYTCYQTHTTSFALDFKYAVNYAAYNHLWDELQGGSKGVVYTKLSRTDGHMRKAGLAMFHQLDCLASIRLAVQKLQDKKTKIEDVDKAMGDEHGYWAHCFDYLRQVILCNADDNIEPSKIVGGKWVSEGFGTVKECRDHKWLHEITRCGEMGCEGKAFYMDPKNMGKIHEEEEKEMEKWIKENEG